MNLLQNKIQGWQLLGNPPSTNLMDARLQIHWAAQVVSSTGITFVEYEADSNHTNMGWIPEQEVLAGHLTNNEPAFRVAIRPRDLTLTFTDNQGNLTSEFELNGRSLEDAYQWLDSAITDYMGRKPEKIARPVYDMPEHAVRSGRPFSLQPLAAFEEVARWCANSDLILRDIQQQISTATPVRCWPHHFDIATLILLQPDKDPETAPSIGLGLAPGDHFYPEPYWYVSPWPTPKGVKLPALAGGGEWNDKGSLMAALPGTAFVNAGSAEAQLEQVVAFLRSAIDESLSLLGESLP